MASKAAAVDHEPLSDEDPEDAEEREGDPKVARLPWRTHVVGGDEYFSYVNNRRYPNFRCYIAGCWLKAGLMGSAEMARRSSTIKQSKCLLILEYDQDEAHPVLSWLLLRAWAVWRMSQYRFCEGHPSRAIHRDSMLRSLTQDVHNFGVAGGSVGVAKADHLFRQWTPSVLGGGGG